MMKIPVKRFPALCVFLAALLLAGCASLQPGDIPPESAWETPEPLRLEMDADVFQIRLDLLRETKDAANSTVIVTEGSYTREDRLVPYHYLGTYIGNGLFLDINGNVAADIIRLFGFDQVYSFKLRKIKDGALDVPQTASREGRTITLNQGGWADSDIVVRIEDGEYSLKTSMLFPPDKILAVDDRLEFLPSGFFSEFRKATIGQEGNITRGSTGYRLELKDENHLNLNGSHEIVREGNKIILKDRGSVILTIVKSADRYVFFRSQSYGSWIEKLPDRIRISENGSITEYAYQTEGRPVKPQPPGRSQAEEKPQPVKRAKRGRVKTDKSVERNTSREASSSLPPN